MKRQTKLDRIATLSVELPLVSLRHLRRYTRGYLKRSYLAMLFGAALSVAWLGLPQAFCQISEKLADRQASSFDAVSVRQVEACQRTVNGPSVTWECLPQKPCIYGDEKVACQLTLEGIVLEAFQRKQYELVGPDWLRKDMYVIQAVFAERTSPANARLMLQTMLADRFGMRSHLERRKLQAYIMVAGSSGQHLEAAQDSEKQQKLVLGGHAGAAWVRSSDRFSAVAMSLDQFAPLLGQTARLDRPVLNGTGLEGKYKFDLHWNPSDDGYDPGILEALKKQTGLVLRKQEVPVDMLVIEHIDRVPTQNP